ncbi:Sulfite reductase [NADPH] flavoprotein alpha-component [Rosistilla ulvae]|uniref:NADPH--hemoprotein reductase n=1 Tax=Rosistilla ulvae TaxID=1930277 RepID=A0A517M4K9_9BACT|nr:sulfite reductase flavoprotein subunit alpha [Rosistilla ulvae]QDS89810.1 Sulfite reductase [NADPH] flavoprotein alpha-component [Rosistilla ulvae]
MANQPPRRRFAEVIGNAVVMLLLVIVALLFLRLTRGAWWIANPPSSRWWLAGGALTIYIGFCLRMLRRPANRLKSNPSVVSATAADEGVAIDPSSIAVVYASQTGFAYELAEQTTALLNESGRLAHLAGIEQIDRDRLVRGGRLLFVASTTGDGDPPDHAYGFLEEVMGQGADLQALEYAVLALGDRTYDQFCAFGRQIDSWLRRHQAQPLFDLIEVDNCDPAAVQTWQTKVAETFETSSAEPWQPAELDDWQLTGRVELNPGSLGGGVYHLTLDRKSLASQSIDWQAGDIAEVEPRNAKASVDRWLQQAGCDGETTIEVGHESTTFAERLSRCELPEFDGVEDRNPQTLADRLKPLKAREYSIASLPSDGNLQLVLRRVVRTDGALGICSGWLCDHLELQQSVRLRIRSNPSFHPQKVARPVILIGNGTGIAGLRGHLKQRVAEGHAENWLLFGERSADRDFFFRDELSDWQQQGLLKRLDLAFSRDGEQRTYVQDRLSEAADELKAWVARDAAIYVCGSLAGMAPAVDAVIRETLGNTLVDQMLADGRYRRDVY